MANKFAGFFYLHKTKRIGLLNIYIAACDEIEAMKYILGCVRVWGPDPEWYQRLEQCQSFPIKGAQFYYAYSTNLFARDNCNKQGIKGSPSVEDLQFRAARNSQDDVRRELIIEIKIAHGACYNRIVRLLLI